jgi:two-component system NtrC family sensor kinase
MRSVITALFILLVSLIGNAQQVDVNTLKQALQKSTSDSDRVLLNLNVSDFYIETNSDSALFFAKQALKIAEKNNQKVAEADALTVIAYQLSSSGKLGESLKCLQQAFTLIIDTKTDANSWSLDAPSPRLKRLVTLSRVHNDFGNLMVLTQNAEQEIFHYKQAATIADEIGNATWSEITDQNLGETYLRLNQIDSAFYFAKRSESLFIKYGSRQNEYGWILNTLGDIYLKKNNVLLAREYYHQGVKRSQENNNMASLTWGYFMLTSYFLSVKDKDSSIYYSNKTIESLRLLGFGYLDENKNMGTAYENLYRSFQLANKSDSANKYQELALITKDSLYKKRIKSLAEFQNLTFDEQLRLQNLKNERVEYENKIRTYALLSGIIVFILIVFFLLANNRNRRKANELLLKQKEEIELQKDNVEKTLGELKSTQAQLIQSEKMASLGELTAGIAHEIQNPLNFVNNFSEVNKELIGEMREEIAKKNFEEVDQIAKDIAENEEKINHHGKRADSIVKGMLQHSQKSTGAKEPTDINALADEYLRLSYHGLRAKDNSFNAAIKTEFDESIGNINIIPQDIGRVLLNLYNNAFYAVAPPAGGGILHSAKNESPTVWVSTKKEDDKVLIIVKDNGNGIPQKIADKIFQPFFTTKPTGQGTGLGLSLSYDIVKAHGGEIKVETEEGEGTTFIIQLPVV